MYTPSEQLNASISEDLTKRTAQTQLDVYICIQNYPDTQLKCQSCQKN